MVATHSSDQNPSFDHAFLQQIAGPNISVASRPIAIDNETGQGIEVVKDALIREIKELGQADRHWPVSYQRLSQALDRLASPEVSWSDLTELGEAESLDPSECETAVIQLAVAGRLTYFKDAVLAGRVILDPDWLTAAISYVLKDQQTSTDGGIINQERLADLWTNPPTAADGSAAKVTFKRSDVPFLVELLHQYGVAFGCLRVTNY